MLIIRFPPQDMMYSLISAMARFPMGGLSLLWSTGHSLSWDLFALSETLFALFGDLFALSEFIRSLRGFICSLGDFIRSLRGFIRSLGDFICSLRDFICSYRGILDCLHQICTARRKRVTTAKIDINGAKNTCFLESRQIHHLFFSNQHICFIMKK